MKTYKIDNTLLEGDYTEHKEVIYKAVKRNNNKPCISQCEAMIVAGRCYGLCFRFKCNNIVFKKTKPDPEKDITIIETPFAASCREYKEQHPTFVKPKEEED